MKTKPCDKCGANIFFARTERGKWLALNEDPVLAGEFVVIEQDRTQEAMRYESLYGVERAAFRNRYDLHFKTCKARKGGRDAV